MNVLFLKIFSFIIFNTHIKTVSAEQGVSVMGRLSKYGNTEFLISQDKRLGEFPSTQSALRLFFSIALPGIAELVFGSLINSVDLVMVGNLGNYAISSVGLNNQPMMLALCLFFAMNVGVTATVARRKGQGDREGASRVLRQALFIELFLSLAMIGVMMLISSPLLKFAGAKEGETLVPAIKYFRTIMSFFVVRTFMLTINAALRGVGETRTTLVANVTSNIVNICFNYLLIEGHFGCPALGVTGAALASGIGFIAGFSISLYSVTRKRSYLCFSFKESFVPDRETIRPIYHVSSNAMLEQLMLRTGFFLMAKFTADLGTDAFAAHTIMNQLVNISVNIGEGLSVATTTLVGQNLGRGRSDLSEMYCKLSQRCSTVISSCYAGLLLLGRYFLPSLFIDDQKVISMVAVALIPTSVMIIFQQLMMIYQGTLRGAGDTRSVAISSAIAVCGIRTVSSFVAVYVFHSLVCLWSFTIIDMVFRFIFLGYRFRLERWKKVVV